MSLLRMCVCFRACLRMCKSIWDQASCLSKYPCHLCCCFMSKHLKAGTALWLLTHTHTHTHTRLVRNMLPSLWVVTELNLLKGWTLGKVLIWAHRTEALCTPVSLQHTHTHSVLKPRRSAYVGCILSDHICSQSKSFSKRSKSNYAAS